MFLSNLYVKPKNNPGIAILNNDIHEQLLSYYIFKSGNYNSIGQFNFFNVNELYDYSVVNVINDAEVLSNSTHVKRNIQANFKLLNLKNLAIVAIIKIEIKSLIYQAYVNK